MNSELAKTISTCAIWMAVAFILTFGFFRMNFNGNETFILLIVVPTVICLSAAGATAVVWKCGPEVKPSRDSAQARAPVVPPQLAGS